MTEQVLKVLGKLEERITPEYNLGNTGTQLNEIFFKPRKLRTLKNQQYVKSL